MRRRLPGRHRMRDHPAHRGQHRVHPPATANRGNPGTGQHLARAAIATRASVLQPGHEQPQMLDSRMPGPARPPAPSQEQRDAARIRFRRQLRAVPPEPDLTQERVRLRDHAQLIIEHRPVPVTGRQSHLECPHPNPPLSRRTAITTISNKSNTGGDVLRNRLSVALTQRHTTSEPPRENAQHTCWRRPAHWCGTAPVRSRQWRGRHPLVGAPVVVGRR